MKPTPGPWNIEPGEWPHKPHIVITAEHAGMTTRSPLATLGCLLGDDEPMADARLIAAAPDLLEALENVIDAASEFDPRQHPRWPEIYKAALSAIHAARGKP